MKATGMKRVLALALTLLTILPCLAACRRGAGDYPNKSIRVICPWGAGGGTDACLRAFAEAMGKDLGRSLNVENITKDEGLAGHLAIADAAPDGYTLGMTTFELSTYRPLGVGDLTWEDYEPLCRVNTDAAAVTVNADWAGSHGISDLTSYVDYCENHPGEVRMGGSSRASVWHVAGYYFMEAAGIDVQMVTYGDGAASAVRDAASGIIQGVTVSPAEARPFLESGHLICLGIMAEERDPLFPHVPTCAEQGYDVQYATHRGLSLPKGVDPEIKARLEDACAYAVQDPDFVAFMEQSGQTISYLNADDYAQFLQRDAQTVAAALEALGLS